MQRDMLLEGQSGGRGYSGATMRRRESRRGSEVLGMERSRDRLCEGSRHGIIC